MSASCCRLRDCNYYTAVAEPTCYTIAEYVFERIEKPSNSLSSREIKFFHYFTPESPAPTTATKIINLPTKLPTEHYTSCVPTRPPTEHYMSCVPTKLPTEHY